MFDLLYYHLFVTLLNANTIEFFRFCCFPMVANGYVGKTFQLSVPAVSGHRPEEIRYTYLAIDLFIQLLEHPLV